MHNNDTAINGCFQEQYRFIYLTLLDLLKMGVTALPIKSFVTQSDSLAKLKRQFEVIILYNHMKNNN